MDLVRQRVVKEELRRELIILAIRALGTDRKVDVYRSTRIPARINGEKLHSAAGIRQLIATQEFLPAGIKSLV